MDLEDIVLSKISQSQDKYSIISLIFGTQSTQIYRDKSKRVVAKGYREEEIGSYCLMGVEFQFCKMKRVLERDDYISL
jgi:hypothetical protein